jgi:hypothetical protein
MSAESKIGFHAARNRITSKETGSDNALIGAYLNQLGLPYPAVFYITQASLESITWLSMADAAKYGIDVQLTDAKSMPEWRPATGPTPAVVMPVNPARNPTVGGMAVGVPSGGVAWGYATGFAINQPNEKAARNAATEMCRAARTANDQG